MGGAGGTIDIRFSRLASVGLIVRAPRPVACNACGATDIRLDDEDGVVTTLALDSLTGVRRALLVEEERA